MDFPTPARPRTKFRSLRAAASSGGVPSGATGSAGTMGSFLRRTAMQQTSAVATPFKKASSLAIPTPTAQRPPSTPIADAPQSALSSRLETWTAEKNQLRRSFPIQSDIEMQHGVFPSPLLAEDVDVFAAALEQADEGDLEALLVTPDSLVAQFIDFCDERIQALRGQGVELDSAEEEGKQELGQWELERNSWLLLRDLFMYLRIWELSGALVYDGTDRMLVTEFQANDPAVVEHVVVREWLETIAPPVNPIDIRKAHYPYTLRESEAARNRGAVSSYSSSLDPDGPARTGKPLHLEDQKNEQNLMKSIFDLLRRGQMLKALQLCRDVNQSWRAASMAGGIYYDDPNLVATGSDIWSDGNAPQGNRNRGLWLLTCFQIANEPSFDKYERAVYGALCGNTSNVLPVCLSWEDRLWAYYNSLVIRLTEEHLKQFPRQQSEEHFYFMFPEIDIHSPSEIHQVLSQCPLEGVANEIRLLFRKIQTSLILDCVDEFLAEFLAAVERQDSVDTQYLRFVVHWILLCRACDFSVDETTASAIIARYVAVLTESDKPELVALYCSKLPYDLQVEKMAVLLQNLTCDMPRRMEILRKAYRYGLDVREVTRRTVQLVFSKYEPPSISAANRMLDIQDPLDASDHVQIEALMWLMIEQDQYLDALLQCNALYRRFLLDGKINAVNALRSKIAECAPTFASVQFTETIRAKYGDIYENILREHTHHVLFLMAVKEYEHWAEVYHKRVEVDATPAPNRLNWLQTFAQATKAVELAFRELLTTTPRLSWLQDDEVEYSTELPPSFSTDRRKMEIAFLRALYIPWIVTTLHGVFRASVAYIPENSNKAMDLVVTVASDDHELYRQFLDGDGGKRLQEWLLEVRGDALELLDQSGSAFS